MSLYCFGSAHGSPGVTTTLLAVAGVWPEDRRVLLVEADPSGGMLAARLGLSDTPGVVSLAAAARRGVDWELVSRHAQQIPGGVPVLVAPPSPEHTRAALGDLAGPLAAWCAGEGDVDVLVDCGRLSPDPPTLPLIRSADRMLVLVRPTVDQLRPAAVRVKALTDSHAGLLLVGDTPYGPGEVEEAFGIAVVGAIAWDPQTAETLAGGGRGNDVRRTVLVRSAASLTDLLTQADTETHDGLPSSQLETGWRVS